MARTAFCVSEITLDWRYAAVTADGGAVHTEPVTDVKDRYRTSKFVKPEDHMDVTLSPTPMEAP